MFTILHVSGCLWPSLCIRDDSEHEHAGFLEVEDEAIDYVVRQSGSADSGSGRVVELVYTRHLKCLGASHAGSTPVSPTNLPAAEQTAR